MAQSSENVCYLPMALDRHSPKAVACLIYESAPELFALMFGPYAISCLAQLVQQSHNRFSHRYIHVAEIDRRVVGIATCVPAACLHDDADYLDSLNRVQSLWLNFVQRFVLRRLLQHTYPADSFYIGNLAVAAEYRNQGIGRQLLSHCIAKAELTSSTVFISVDISNPRAQKLYESLGFQPVETKTIRLFGAMIGSQVLSLAPS